MLIEISKNGSNVLADYLHCLQSTVLSNYLYYYYYYKVNVTPQIEYRQWNGEI